MVGGISGFVEGDVISISTSTPGAGVSVGIGDSAASANLVTSPTLATYTVTAANASNTFGDFVFNTSGSPATYTYACTPAPAAAPKTDSIKLQTLQTVVTKMAATLSTQVITNQVAGAVSDAFSDGGNPVTVNPNGMTINFAATPKSDVEKRADEAFSALGYAGMPTKAPSRAYNEWSAWLDLRGTGFQNHDINVGLSGAQYNVTGGLSRKLTPDFLVGIVTGYEHIKYTMSAIDGSTKANGGSIGGYFGWRFGRLRLDGMGGYTGLNYSGTAGTASGSFKGNRWVASSTLTGTHGYGFFVLEPSASVYALWERQTAYTDSLGTAQVGRTFSAGRVSLGGKAIRPWVTNGTKVSPYVGFYGDWRFSSDTATPGGSTVVGIGDGWSGRAVAGIALTGSRGMVLTLGGDYGGIGAKYKLWTGHLSATVPFSSR